MSAHIPSLIGGRRKAVVKQGGKPLILQEKKFDYRFPHPQHDDVENFPKDVLCRFALC